MKYIFIILLFLKIIFRKQFKIDSNIFLSKIALKSYYQINLIFYHIL